MSVKQKAAMLLAFTAVGTAAFGAYVNGQPHEIGNYTTLIVEIGVGISIAIIVYYFSSKSDAEIKNVVNQTNRIAKEQVKLKEKQTAKARQELVESLNSISKDTKRGLYYADLQTRRMLPNVDKGAIEVVCNSVKAHIDGLDRLNTLDHDVFSASDKRRLHTLKMWSDKPVGEVDGVKFCMTIRNIVDGWLKSMDRAEGSDIEEQGVELAISAEVDRTVYPIGGTVYVRTRVIPVIEGENIHCQVFDQKGAQLWSEEIDPKGAGRDPELSARGIFEASFQIRGPEWKTECRYRITAAFGGQTADVEFFVNHHVPVIQSDRPAYTLPSAMIVTVVDPDSNKDGRSVESIGDRPDSKIVIESDLGRIDGYRLVESGPGTGIFQGVVEIDAGEPQEERGQDGHAARGTGGDGRIACKKGEEIRIRYTNGTDTAELTARAENSDAVVETDRETYTCTDRVRIVVTVSTKPDREDGYKKDCKVSVRTSIGELAGYLLAETDAGVFTGEILLTGFEGMEEHVGAGKQFGATGGDGPKGGTLACQAKDRIEVAFAGGGLPKIAKASWNMGKIRLDRTAYRTGQTAVVTVEDPDMNLDPDAEDSFEVRARSDSDMGGIPVTVRETGPATGIFEGRVLLGSSGSSEDDARLQVADGDIVRAEYEDTTVPEMFGSPAVEVGTYSLVAPDGTAVPPLESGRIEIGVRNEKTGSEIIADGDAVAVTVKVVAPRRPADFVAVLQVKNMAGATQDTMQHPMDSESGKTEHTFAWTPSEPGVFEVTAFLWRRGGSPFPLCAPVTKEVNVV